MLDKKTTEVVINNNRYVVVYYIDPLIGELMWEYVSGKNQFDGSVTEEQMVEDYADIGVELRKQLGIEEELCCPKKTSI